MPGTGGHGWCLGGPALLLSPTGRDPGRPRGSSLAKGFSQRRPASDLLSTWAFRPGNWKPIWRRRHPDLHRGRTGLVAASRGHLIRRAMQAQAQSFWTICRDRADRTGFSRYPDASRLVAMGAFAGRFWRDLPVVQGPCMIVMTPPGRAFCWQKANAGPRGPAILIPVR